MMASKDLRPILAGWPYRPGQITVRKIVGLDKSVKIQMRLDLGLLQMHETGRPDGQHPHETESLLDHHLARLADHYRRNGTELGFELSADTCRELRDEAVLYYYRYLSLFVLEEFDGVERDTARNLKVLDFCRKFAAEPYDRFVLEQYRPYILMMNTRAKAHRALHAKAYRVALTHVETGLTALRHFFRTIGQEETFDECREVKILTTLRSKIKKNIPTRPVDRLRRKLDHALEAERYEEAATLRDQIKGLEDREA